MRRLLVAALGCMGWGGMFARAADAYPTSVWNVPTATVADAGILHVGVYTYSTLARSVAIQDGLTFGALPGLEIGGVPGIGAMELGVDTYGSSEAFNAKLQLIGETTYTPAFGVGGLNLASTTGPSENLVYAAVTKEVGPEDMSGGSWTIGYFNTLPSDPEAAPEGGVMGGMTFDLTSALTAGFDFMMGATSVSGGNLFVNYAVSEGTLLTLGYYLHPRDSSQNLIFIGADIDVPTGLFGTAAGKEP